MRKNGNMIVRSSGLTLSFNMVNTSAMKVNVQKKNRNSDNFQAGFGRNSLIKELEAALSAKNLILIQIKAFSGEKE